MTILQFESLPDIEKRAVGFFKEFDNYANKVFSNSAVGKITRLLNVTNNGRDVLVNYSLTIRKRKVLDVSLKFYNRKDSNVYVRKIYVDSGSPRGLGSYTIASILDIVGFKSMTPTLLANLVDGAKAWLSYGFMPKFRSNNVAVFRFMLELNTNNKILFNTLKKQIPTTPNGLNFKNGEDFYSWVRRLRDLMFVKNTNPELVIKLKNNLKNLSYRGRLIADIDKIFFAKRITFNILRNLEIEDLGALKSITNIIKKLPLSVSNQVKKSIQKAVLSKTIPQVVADQILGTIKVVVNGKTIPPVKVPLKPNLVGNISAVNISNTADVKAKVPDIVIRGGVLRNLIKKDNLLSAEFGLPSSRVAIGLAEDIFKLQFTDAVDSLAILNPVKGVDYYSFVTKIRQQSFTLAMAGSIQQVANIQKSLVTALKQGNTFKQWARKIIISEELQNVSRSYLNLVYQNAMSTSYNAGKFLAADLVKESRPVWVYDAIEDRRTSNICLSLAGQSHLADSSFWQQYTPPNHHNCRSSFYTLSTGQATNLGVKVGDGNIRDIPVKPAIGWEGNSAATSSKLVIDSRESKRVLNNKFALVRRVVDKQAFIPLVSRWNYLTSESQFLLLRSLY